MNLNEVAPESVYKLMESVYFLQKMVESYQDPDAFCFNLNATVQAIRNVTFVMQAELASDSRFTDWYPSKQAELRAHELMRKFVDARNLVVKRKSLETSSLASVGVFCYRQFKLGTSKKVAPCTDSQLLLKLAKESFPSMFLDPNRKIEWEQLGVKREWFATELGSDEIVKTCNEAIDLLGKMLSELAPLLACEFHWESGPITGLAECQVLLESDLDSSLPSKWGWQ